MALLLAQELLNFIFPISCGICGSWLEDSPPAVLWSRARISRPLLHRRCLSELAWASWPATSDFSGQELHLGWALRDDPTFFRLLHSIKYGGELALLEPLALRLASRAQAVGWLEGVQGVVPLPDDPARRRQRGGSLTLGLAKALATVIRCPVYEGLLRRQRGRPPQALMGEGERAANAATLFRVGRPSELLGAQRLLLVDDQLTSGESLRAAARLLAVHGHGLRGIALAAASRAPRRLNLTVPPERL